MNLFAVRKQLDKLVPVIRVDDISAEDFVERDLMLIKVNAPRGRRRHRRRERPRRDPAHPLTPPTHTKC